MEAEEASPREAGVNMQAAPTRTEWISPRAMLGSFVVVGMCAVLCIVQLIAYPPAWPGSAPSTPRSCSKTVYQKCTRELRNAVRWCGEMYESWRQPRYAPPKAPF
jgi:hypothetical protein